jgi:hypothetical protein
VAGRYTPLRDRVGRARMTLLANHPVVNRYEFSIAALHPRIHLAIGWALNPPVSNRRTRESGPRTVVAHTTLAVGPDDAPSATTLPFSRSLPPLERVFWRLKNGSLREYGARTAAAGSAPALARLARLGKRVEDSQWAKERPSLATRAVADRGRMSPAEVEQLVRRAAVATASRQAGDSRATYSVAGEPQSAGGYRLPTPVNGVHRASAPAASPTDVDHLAEQVMRHIDRRMVAYRERMGRGF